MTTLGAVIGIGILLTIIIVCDAIDANRRFNEILDNVEGNN